jgi:hypothetical protein
MPEPTLLSTANIGTTEGLIPTLGAGGKLASSLLPSIALTETLSVANAAARLALTSTQAQGKIVIEADTGKSYGLVTAGNPATSGDWLQLGDKDIAAADITDSTAAGRALLMAADAAAQIAALGAETPAGADAKIAAAAITGPWFDDADAEVAGVPVGRVYKQPAGAIAWRQSADFSPLSLSPCFWIDASALDLADGANVSSVADLSGNSRTATASGTAPTFEAAGPSGMPWILSPGRTLQTASFPQFPSKRGAWFIVYVPTGTVAQTALLGTLGGTAPTWLAYNNDDFANRYFYSSAFGTSPARLQGDQAGEVVIRGVRRTSDTDFEWYRGGSRQWAFTLADHQPADNPLKIGQAFSGRIGEVIGFDTELTEDQFRKVAAYLTKKWGGERPLNLSFEGDSQTYGANFATANDELTYPAQTYALLADYRAAFTNHGVSSSKWVELEGRAATVDASRNPRARNTLIVWCGTNETSTDDAPASIAAATSYLADRKAAGWDDILVLTAMSRADQVNETWRTAYNTGLINLCNSAGYVLVDIAANEFLGYFNAHLDTDYFQVDGIHINTTGAGVVAGLVATALNNLD